MTSSAMSVSASAAPALVGDVDGTIAYVAPNNVDDRDDRAYDAFLARVGTDPSCRERLNALQQEALGA